jgi:hypothetical protein
MRVLAWRHARATPRAGDDDDDDDVFYLFFQKQK